MQILVPTVSATFKHEGRRYRWIRGRTTIEAGSPLLKGREHMVEPLRIDHPAPTPRSESKQNPEAKTAAPAKTAAKES